jgi:hypothetical protein
MSAALDRGGVALHRPVFVFSGHGGQGAGMGLELWDAFPAFAAGIEECAAALRRYVDWSLEDVLRGVPGAPALERVDVVQPPLFAVMVSLARYRRLDGNVEATRLGCRASGNSSHDPRGSRRYDGAGRRGLACPTSEENRDTSALSEVSPVIDRTSGRTMPSTLGRPVT